MEMGVIAALWLEAVLYFIYGIIGLLFAKVIKAIDKRVIRKSSFDPNSSIARILYGKKGVPEDKMWGIHYQRQKAIERQIKSGVPQLMPYSSNPSGREKRVSVLVVLLFLFRYVVILCSCICYITGVLGIISIFEELLR